MTARSASIRISVGCFVLSAMHASWSSSCGTSRTASVRTVWLRTSALACCESQPNPRWPSSPGRQRNCSPTVPRVAGSGVRRTALRLARTALVPPERSRMGRTGTRGCSCVMPPVPIRSDRFVPSTAARERQRECPIRVAAAGWTVLQHRIQVARQGVKQCGDGGRVATMHAGASAAAMRTCACACCSSAVSRRAACSSPHRATARAASAISSGSSVFRISRNDSRA